MIRIALGLCLLALGGCAVQQRIQAKSEYLASTEAYKACLADNAARPQNCEAARLAMEADERKLSNSRLPQEGAITVINR